MFTQHRQGGGPEPEGGHDTGGLGVDEVADLGAGQWRVAEVVVGGDERVVDAGVGAGGDRARPAGCRARSGRCAPAVWRGPGCAQVPAVAVGVTRCGQDDESVGRHFVQRDPGAHRLGGAVDAPPAPGGVLHASNHDGVAPHEAAYNLAQGRVRTAMELRGQLPSN